MAASGTEEFRIDKSRVPQVNKCMKKVEKLFRVKVTFDMTHGHGDINNQWLLVLGNKENRQKAMRYIQFMCNPEQMTSLRVDDQWQLDTTVLENTECASNAFIERTGPVTLQVKGSELACALAVSLLEQEYKVTITGVRMAEQEEMMTDCPTTSQSQQTSPGTATTQRSSPTQMLAGMKDMTVGITKQDKTPSQAANPSCHLGPSPAVLQASGRQVPAGCGHLSGKGDTNESSARETQTQSRGRKQAPKSSATITSLSENVASKLEGKAEGGISEAESGEASTDEVKQKRELRSLGLGMGYSLQEMEDTWPFFDFSQQKVQPHEFLTALDEVRANRLKGETAQRQPQTKKRTSPNTASHPNRIESPSTSEIFASSRGSSDKGEEGRQPPSKSSPSGSKLSAGRGKSAELDASLILVSPEKIASSGKKCFQDAFGRGGKAHDESIIFVSEEESGDDSVCIVDALPEVSSWRIGKPAPAGSNFPQKRKDNFPDDKEQTKVLRPYCTNPLRVGDGGSERKQESAQAAQGGDFDSHSSAAASSSETAATFKGSSDLRYIVIDGSNVAMSHGNDQEYSCRGIQICVDYFAERGHKVKAWVPRTMTYQNKAGRKHAPVRNQEILEQLKEQGFLGYTPARTFNRKHVVSHDDPFILELARREDAVIVSNDNFREFVREFTFIIENRVLSYVFSDDHFILPRDPLGRDGPTLEQFLCKSPPTTTTTTHPHHHPATDHR